ncbi:hypothetical protein GZH53_19015 [Flavihumibacter sp. R14]|nr:hypothetical protein [Flavihumibacter soli]
MKRLVYMALIAGTFTAMGCSSNNSNGESVDSTDMMAPDTAESLMGADTTSAKTDSLRDSLNR